MSNIERSKEPKELFKNRTTYRIERTKITDSIRIIRHTIRMNKRYYDRHDHNRYPRSTRNRSRSRSPQREYRSSHSRYSPTSNREYSSRNNRYTYHSQQGYSSNNSGTNSNSFNRSQNLKSKSKSSSPSIEIKIRYTQYNISTENPWSELMVLENKTINQIRESIINLENQKYLKIKEKEKKETLKSSIGKEKDSKSLEEEGSCCLLKEASINLYQLESNDIHKRLFGAMFIYELCQKNSKSETIDILWAKTNETQPVDIKDKNKKNKNNYQLSKETEKISFLPSKDKITYVYKEGKQPNQSELNELELLFGSGDKGNKGGKRGCLSNDPCVEGWLEGDTVPLGLDHKIFNNNNNNNNNNNGTSIRQNKVNKLIYCIERIVGIKRIIECIFKNRVEKVVPKETMKKGAHR